MSPSPIGLLLGLSHYLRILGVFWVVFIASEKFYSLHVRLQQFKFFLGKIWKENYDTLVNNLWQNLVMVLTYFWTWTETVAVNTKLIEEGNVRKIREELNKLDNPLYHFNKEYHLGDSLVFLKCLSVTWSTGKKLTVALYSGHMLAMVVRSGADSWETPGPKNSTNFPAIPACRKCWKINAHDTLVRNERRD